MPMIYLPDGGTISVCHDSTGTTQITHSQNRCALTIAGLTADQCYQLSDAFAKEALRQRAAMSDNIRLRDIHDALRADEQVAA